MCACVRVYLFECVRERECVNGVFVCLSVCKAFVCVVCKAGPQECGGVCAYVCVCECVCVCVCLCVCVCVLDMCE